MHLIIDGNNLIHQSSELFPAQDMERGREALLLALRLYRQKKTHRVTVVFDGGSEPEPSRATRQGVPVVWAGARHSADQVIVEMVGRHGAGMTVVTDDRELGELCRAKGAEVVPARVFAGLLLDTAQGRAPIEEDEEGWDFTTRKKGPSRREPRARRRQRRRLERL